MSCSFPPQAYVAIVESGKAICLKLIKCLWAFFLENNFGCNMSICLPFAAGKMLVWSSLAASHTGSDHFCVCLFCLLILRCHWPPLKVRHVMFRHAWQNCQNFQNENKTSKNSGEFTSCKINQIWTFSKPKRYKTRPIDKTQLFRIFLHNKMFSYITTAKRKPHNFFIELL